MKPIPHEAYFLLQNGVETAKRIAPFNTEYRWSGGLAQPPFNSLKHHQPGQSLQLLINCTTQSSSNKALPLSVVHKCKSDYVFLYPDKGNRRWPKRYIALTHQFQ